MNFDTDLLDNFCEQIYGHTNWAFFDTLSPQDKKEVLKNEKVVVFYKEPCEE